MNIWQHYYKQHHVNRDPHIYGMCKVNDQHKLFYVLVPKNASTSIRTNLGKSGFRDGNYHDEKLLKQGYTPIIVLREPIERWCSGFAEYINRRMGGKWSPILKSEEALKLIFQRPAQDEHTESQSMYIHGLDTGKSHVLRFDEELNKNLAALLRGYGIDNEIDDTGTKYMTSGGKLDCKTFLMEMLQNDEDKMNRIKAFYRLDTELYDSVKYYIREDKD